MKTIGLIGGMSWESTVTYYQQINRCIGRELGGLHSARMVMYSVDFDELQELQHVGKWHEIGVILADAAKSIESAGADLVVLCTNTMHIVAPQIEAATSLPFLHIADATALSIKAAGMQRIGLLGTSFTMEGDFYRGRLEDSHNLSVVTPCAADRAIVHRVIYDELCRGEVEDASRAEYTRIVAALVAEGAEGIILGCTEIGLLLRPEDSPVPLFDTAHIHAESAAMTALQGLC